MQERLGPLQETLRDWRAQWPEWQVAEAFVPASQRLRAAAWLALRMQLAQAAWGGGDPRPGTAKLGWWAEELQGWAQGRRRHPLGQALQPAAAPWAALAQALPVLAAARASADSGEDARLLAGCAAAQAAVAAALFGVDAAASDAAAGRLLAGERRLLQPAEHGSLALPDLPGPLAATRPERIHAALVQARLRRRALGHAGPVPLPAALLRAWRAARG
ncbi:phytoene/squalene synthase family protein [Thermomonas flagellata]|uniref:phytoene/squalene synthase family protein n=1 Tax=Thermomonas flagellata TaxID=2888524 RepID=UPI001F03ED84|nr:phytoene/squalene synthase family protein [Thermomonas flagellata]